MRIHWDEDKRQLVLRRRKIDFTWLEELLCLPYVEDQRNDDPEQYRIIGFARDRLVTFIIEYREYRQDRLGEFIWVVTAWNATREEFRTYERKTG